MTDDRLRLEYIDLKQARLWDRNPKRHDFNALATSIKRYGFKDPPKFEPLLNDGQGGIVEGNGRMETLQRMKKAGEDPPRGIATLDNGNWAIPVLFGVDSKSEITAEAYGIDHNQIVVLGSRLDFEDLQSMWDDDIGSVLKDLSIAEELPTSLIDESLDFLVEFTQPELPDPPQVNPSELLLKKWKVEVGQIWQLGAHKVICGDCTDKAVVDRLMDGEVAELGMHDPPYGIDTPNMTLGLGKKEFARKDFDKKRVDISHLLPMSKYTCIWGGNYYADLLPVSNNWLCWDKKNPNLGYSEFELAWTNYNKNTRIINHHWSGEIKKHPTQKPLPVIEWAIKLVEANLVIDFYLGSGTTLVACEGLSLKCYGIEIEPEYVAVILERWHLMTDQDPILISNLPEYDPELSQSTLGA